MGETDWIPLIRKNRRIGTKSCEQEFSPRDNKVKETDAKNVRVMSHLSSQMLSVSDPYSLNPDPNSAKNLNPDPEDPWIQIQSIS